MRIKVEHFGNVLFEGFGFCQTQELNASIHAAALNDHEHIAWFGLLDARDIQFFDGINANSEDDADELEKGKRLRVCR
eukprot:CAMPEP_0169281794 /NCGR_PEP_ID=MMETSP1016-20121227/56489_1 /TAXON_ID=342587 /ORGANISM="Karlodinium micrum, Strain CCMP2283" /LENGTH=77 /DNA_ID=CAMNT_0009370527 /DNA_START=163 /DNA_END=396 /DNA_ORIENTATION=+